MYHYVYRITNIKYNKHYYGTRTSKTDPKIDLGEKYFSSSTNKDFIKDQQENTQDYKYKIIQKFRNREEALKLEIKLHNKFDVGINEVFYNKAKQTSVGFDTTGIRQTEETKQKKKDYWNNLSKDVKENFIEKCKGRKHSEETKNKLRIINTGKKYGPCTEERKEKIRKKRLGVRGQYTHTEEYKNKMSNKYKGEGNPFYNKKHTKESIKKISEAISGENNPRARYIIIYDNNDNIVYECKGTFHKLCKENKLPVKYLLDSIELNGKIDLSTKRKNIQEKYKKFNKWYAREF